MKGRVPVAHWAALAAGLTLLNASLTFVNVWPTLGVRMSPRLSIEAVLLVAGLAIAGALSERALTPAARRLLAIAWVVLALVHYIEISSRSLYGRNVNLYWDLKLLPDVGAMFAYVAQPRVLAGVLVGVVLVPLLLYIAVRWAIGCVSEASIHPLRRRVLLTGVALSLLAGTAPLASDRLSSPLSFARPVSLALAGEAVEFVWEASGLAHEPLPPAPNVRNDLARVLGADVIVLFVESYGATSWDRPEFSRALAPAREQLVTAIADTGRASVTAMVESTTFGGESWLAHISLLSGTEVRDPDVNRRLMTERRDTMVTTFARAGYDTVAIMPGLQAPWPEGRFYGFDRIYSAADLGYAGPPFGWWDVTDQFVIARMDALALGPGTRPPVFVFLPSISTHAPFTPVPPYQPDWARALTPAPYDDDELMLAYEETADWTNLGPGYARSLAYTYETLGGYLRLRADRDMVFVIIGDHQPPALVSGEGASWDVPVHVVASRPAVLARLRSHGFVDGLTPRKPALARMDTLMPILLDAFGNAP
ncbi:MAG: sulfatase-like hydrolase/transferase [Acidobacteriota bacterium]|nr:sulfatase-like hydrolase/transferase [Acidobacteriota bacterium]